MDVIQNKINNNLKALEFLDIESDIYKNLYTETNELIEKMIVENSI